MYVERKQGSAINRAHFYIVSFQVIVDSISRHIVEYMDPN